MSRNEAHLWLAAAWTALSPIHPALAMAVALPLADLILACISSWKANKTGPHSYGIGRTIGKIALYLTTLLLAFATERWMTGPIGIMSFITTVIGARELKSCLEHLDEIHGGSLLKSSISFLVPKSKSSEDDKESSK